MRRQTPDGILLAVGLNDSARVGRPDGRQQLSQDALGFGMGQLLMEIGQHTQVMVLGLTPVDEHVMPFADCLWYCNEDVQSHEAVMAEACREANVPFLPLHGAMLEEPEWLGWIEPDGLHVNHHGHAWIHRQVTDWAALQSWAGLESLNTSVPLME